ncbi:glycine/D-amino acid oxidase-like deaminating enzyme [Kibdelosporangium banguiense]|uniref:Glycine/D-amino acid oxidase-like deaminating enzyme n=1 Tax=Kibdelosporangium banguiense TaxID=1365924 RepID=A0ABS4TPX9_9PSEU|nr:FAD-dependent oxidoreductase [Kibdelosporangium banguiense]MBP2326462.1 glycine/D-amino acid oxidase-like deaminating enzyme [Kibdelosporangium banguiense]
MTIVHRVTTADPVRALVDAEPVPFWLDDPARPAPVAALAGEEHCDLVVVGGGYCGLWTALLAKERHPGRDVILIEAREVGWAASGRNGGFCDANLTHGFNNGLARWPDELTELQRLGMENLDGIEETVRRYGIDCDWERTGTINVATRPHETEHLREEAELAKSYGTTYEFLGTDAVRAEVASPTYLAGLRDRDGCALVNPAKLAWGLREACARLGVRIFERTHATGLSRRGASMVVTTGYGRIVARHVVLATNAFPSLLRRARPYVIPVYDYVLVTEPLTQSQQDSLGWHNRQGMGDAANQFHYYRLTPDNRILWGGYDAIYHYGAKLSAELDQRPDTFKVLATNFFDTFPQLEGIRFTHSWGGVIDTCTRFSAFFGTAARGQVAYALGFTGHGVGATRFAAQVMLDRLDGARTSRTELNMVRSKPLPFPPEPVRWLGVELTRRSMARADSNSGKRNLWLQAMDAIGLGFDS